MSDGATPRCADAEPYLSALADGEVAEPLRSAVAAHAASCEHCGELLARHRAVKALFAALPASAPSPAVLDHILAATTASEPAQRESLRRRGMSTLGVRRLATLLTLPRVEPRPALALPRPRSFWQATALPTLVAILLISFTFAVFSRVSPNLLGGQTAHTATPTPGGDAYQQAHAAVVAAIAANPVSFTPEIPWSLPPGATFQHASVDPSTGALDIVWTLTGALAQLHVHEAPVPLGDAKNGYAVPTNPPTPLVWQLPGKSAWRTGTYTVDPARLAVVQDDGATSAAVDVAFPSDVSASQVDPTTQTQAANVLRLASLSMDSTRFTVPALAAPDAQSGVLHYTVQSGSGASRVVRNAYVDLTNSRAHVTVSDSRGTLLYEDFISGGVDTRYDHQRGVYGHPSGASAITLADAQLDGSTSAFFTYNVNDYLAYGNLWYTGQGTWNDHSAYELALTTAPYRTTIYADATTHTILGATVDYTAQQNAGAQGVTSPLTPSACQSYLTVEFLPSAPLANSPCRKTTPPGRREPPSPAPPKARHMGMSDRACAAHPRRVALVGGRCHGNTAAQPVPTSFPRRYPAVFV